MLRLETERLILRNLEENDADALYPIRESEYVMRYNAMASYTMEDWRMRVKRAAGKDGVFCLVDKATSRPIGMIDVHDDDLRWKIRAYDLSYWLDESFAGQGLMTEALTAAVDWTFAALHAEVVSARCFAPNASSRRVLEKLGMRQEGCLRHAVQGWQHIIYDDCLYAVTRGEWLSIHNQATTL